MPQNLRPQVMQLYKNLLHLGREYPAGYDYFKGKLKAGFLKNKDMTEPRDIKKKLAGGRYIMKELEALYMLKKYRAMKSRYYND